MGCGRNEEQLSKGEREIAEQDLSTVVVVNTLGGLRRSARCWGRQDERRAGMEGRAVSSLL